MAHTERLSFLTPSFETRPPLRQTTTALLGEVNLNAYFMPDTCVQRTYHRVYDGKARPDFFPGLYEYVLHLKEAVHYISL